MRSALVVALLLGSSSLGLACTGQTGKVIFSDDFTDDSGGWDVDSTEKYIKGALQIVTGPKSTSDSSLNDTFTATDGDYCVEVAFPSDHPGADNADDAGIYILSSDYQNRYSFSINTDGVAWVNRVVKGVTTHPVGDLKVPAIKTEPGAVNALRVVVKDQKLTFYVNGEKVKVLRVQTEPDANRFGFWAGSDKKAPDKERISLVKSYSLTEAP